MYVCIHGEQLLLLLLLYIGDDCIPINGGCSFINITGVACGPGHGIRFVKMEKKKKLHCFHSCTHNSMFYLQGGSGYARKISFEQITLIASKNPIITDQHYSGKGQQGCQRVCVYIYIKPREDDSLLIYFNLF